MKTTKKLPFFVLALLFLMGCQAKSATDDTDSDDAVREWFAAEEPNYDIVSIDTIKDGEYVLLTTFTPPATPWSGLTSWAQMAKDILSKS